MTNRKEKKLLARGERIKRVAMKAWEGKVSKHKINKTSLQLMDVLCKWEFQAIDNHLLACAVG